MSDFLEPHADTVASVHAERDAISSMVEREVGPIERLLDSLAPRLRRCPALPHMHARVLQAEWQAMPPDADLAAAAALQRSAADSALLDLPENMPIGVFEARPCQSSLASRTQLSTAPHCAHAAAAMRRPSPGRYTQHHPIPTPPLTHNPHR